ncbi:Sodium/hydrogen exchanger [Basidiobolus meristosporus CBS 931.73]|uniref:Sodium/hydrogen exchanger n=1 Tax=Basidiobolus meristosporus CBS 931.73 TaxID=1314790 RepID=A0A1Y1ZAH8_9FUNG|nr:Sodium/hydrogen exchanger [Basidiobolus meristosporus CBS 931.73]|eukprot:ORY07313.1 Sodium/hydrogen exchanger [Basidiobolus meristosporus CBS 931.73]
MSSLIELSIYLATLYLGGKLFSLFYADLVGHLLVGILLVAWGNLLPQFLTEALTSVGKLGMLLLVFEGGLSIEFEQVKKGFSQALLIALTGTFLPFGLGAVFGHFVLKFSWLEAIISAASLASTSIGIIIMLLSQQGITKTHFGALITIAALLDDIFSLVILAVMKQIGPIMQGTHNKVQPWLVARPFIVSVVFIILGICFFASLQRVVRLINIKLMSVEVTKSTLPSVQEDSINEELEREFDEKVSPYLHRLKVLLLSKEFLHRSILLFMLLAGLVFSTLAETLGSSELLGAFVAGFLFAPYALPLDLFQEYVHPIMGWTTPVFFSSVGFIVPVASLFTPANLGKGALYTIVMALTKFVAGMWVNPIFPDGVIVGVAMIARGEIGLVMASESVKNGMMGESPFIVTVWAIVVCTFVAPLGVAWGLKVRQRIITQVNSE